MKIFKSIVMPTGVLGWLLLMLCGCESLPDGDPPIGPIVKSRLPENGLVSIEQAVNYMTTSLTAVCIQHGLMGTAVLKPFSDAYSNKVFRQVASITGIVAVTVTARPKLLLTSKFIRRPHNMIWEMRLISLDSNKVIWNSQRIIKSKSSNMSPKLLH